MLHIIVKQLGLSGTTVAYTGDDKDRMEALLESGVRGPSINLTEYSVDSLAEADGGRKKDKSKRRKSSGKHLHEQYFFGSHEETNV